MKYSDQLKDPRWQKRRLEILNRHDWRCMQCGDESQTMHVHHRYYISGRVPWEYPDFALVVLCDYHHEEIHDHQKQGGLLPWETVMIEMLEGRHIPAATDFLCIECRKPVRHGEDNRMGKGQFICEECALAMEAIRCA